MLIMNAHKRSCQVIVGMLLCGLPAVGLARSPRRAATPAEQDVVEPGSHISSQSVGAPQVLEIPPVQDSEATGTTAPPVEAEPPVATHAPEVATPYERGRRTDIGNSEERVQRTYLGALYATADSGPVGVKVLDVIPGSPAARAGFEGVNAPPSQSSDLVKLGLVALMMSPVGAFAMPLVIAHDMYMASQSPGDLIVAVGDQQIHDAVEFSQELHRYHPGDTVTFSIVRKGKPLQVPVRLEEEPS